VFNIALCDDDKTFASLFKDFLNRQIQALKGNSFEYKIGVCVDNGKELLEYLKENKVDVLFLDIDMPEMNGFEIAKIVSREYTDTLIVFMSAYDNFVYESFDYLPFAYLRKEKISDELQKVINRIRDRLLEKTRYITLVSSNKEIKIDLNDILYFESVKNYYVVQLASGEKYSCRGTITKLENEVGSMGFFRTHSAFLVNLEYVDRVSNEGFVIIDGYEIPVAQKRAKEFKRAFLEYIRRHIGI